MSKDVLIVGPNKGFIRYISAVLPSLGDEAVVQLPLTGLGPRVCFASVSSASGQLPFQRDVSHWLASSRVLDRWVTCP